jgi:hypothetical protein
MARSASTTNGTGTRVAASTPGVNTRSSSPFGLRALRVDTGAPPTAHELLSAAPLVRRGQKTVIGTFAREVDMPFHINAGTVGRFATMGIPNRLPQIALEAHGSRTG